MRSQISLVFQEPILFAATIAENISVGKPNAEMAEIVEAAKQADIDRLIRALPDGYDTSIGERGATLSGGQRQCVAIARAIIRNAPIVILDEPTVGLDSQSAALVMKALDRLTQGRTVVMISHQLDALTGADLVVVLDGGRVLEQGTFAELRANDGLFRMLERHQEKMVLQ